MTSDLITRVRAAGITIGVEYDDELNGEARMVIEDLLFKLSQRTDEVSHLEKKVEGLRRETVTRKHADSDEQDRRPSKRREPSRGVTPPHTIWKTEGFPASNHPLPRPTEDVTMLPPMSERPPPAHYRQDTTPNHERQPYQGPPPRRPEPFRRTVPRQPRTVEINGRLYEGAVIVTPPGPFVPEPDILSSVPLALSDSPPVRDGPQDPYNFSESDEEDGPQNQVLQGPRDMSDDGGHVPKFWGLREVEGFPRYERDNCLRQMLSRSVYFSPRTNTVFAGQTATDASRYEMDNRETFPLSQISSQVYARSPRGIPMNPLEARKLVTVVKTPQKFSHRERAEAYLLLVELHNVARRVIPSYRDASMRYTLETFHPTENYRLPSAHFMGSHITRAQSHQLSMTNAPSLSESMDIDTYGLHLLLHNRPGSVSPVSGVTIDFAFRVGRRTVFGYTLSRLLCPTDREAQMAFRRQFAFLVALPRRYREAIVDHDRANPLSPFVPQRGPAFSTHRAHVEASQVRNMSVQEVANYLIDNRIPPEWVDHAYVFGLRFLEVHYSGAVIHQGLLEPIDNERLARLRAYGTPAPITAWDGWRHPSEVEVTHIHQIMNREETRAAAQNTSNAAHQRGMGSPSWLLVGQDGVTEFLTHRPRQVAEAYASSHPVELHSYSELESPPTPIAAASLSGNPRAEPASMDAVMSTNVEPAPPMTEQGGDHTMEDPAIGTIASTPGFDGLGNVPPPS